MVVIEMTREEFNKRLKESLQYLAVDVETGLKKVVPVDTGNLRRSIRCEVKDNELNVYMWDYAWHLETKQEKIPTMEAPKLPNPIAPMMEARAQAKEARQEQETATIFNEWVNGK